MCVYVCMCLCVGMGLYVCVSSYLVENSLAFAVATRYFDIIHIFQISLSLSLCLRLIHLQAVWQIWYFLYFCFFYRSSVLSLISTVQLVFDQRVSKQANKQTNVNFTKTSSFQFCRKQWIIIENYQCVHTMFLCQSNRLTTLVSWIGGQMSTIARFSTLRNFFFSVTLTLPLSLRFYTFLLQHTWFSSQMSVVHTQIQMVSCFL